MSIPQVLFEKKDLTRRVKELEQQLANATKQIVMLRGALHGVVLATDPCVMVRYATEVLAATQDLSGYILCDAEPVGAVGLANRPNGADEPYGNLYEELAEGTPLYKAKELK